MGVPVQALLMAAQFLNSKEGKKFTDALTDKVKGDAAMEALETGNDSSPGMFDYGSSRYKKALDNQTKRGVDMFNMLRRVSGVTPQQLLIKAGLAAGSDAIRTWGDTRVNNANALAQALLSRNQTEAQTNAWGKNYADLARQNYAIHRTRDAANKKRIAEVPAKAIDAAAGAYNYGTGMAGMIAANQALGGNHLPGLFYAHMTQAMKHGGLGPAGTGGN